MPKKRRDLLARFWSKVLIGEDGECWPWKASLSTGGYGKFGVPPSGWKTASVVALEWDTHTTSREQGKRGLEAAHLCGNPICVNPLHLAWKTKSGNAKDRLVHGTDARGEKSALAKLSDKQADDVRQLYEDLPKTKSGQAARGTIGPIARAFGVSKSLIVGIGKGRFRVHDGV